MGNINRRMIVAEDIPLEIWTNILLQSDIKTIISFGQTSKSFNLISEDNYIWKCFSNKLKHTKSYPIAQSIIEMNWKKYYQIYIRSIVKSIEVLIGDRTNPENRILIQLQGNGKCYISGRYSRDYIYPVVYNSYHYEMVPITEITLPLYYELNELNGIYKYIPFTNDYKKKSIIFTERRKLEQTKIIDISSFDPFIILLSDNNRVFEFVLTPEWYTDYKNFAIPTEIIIPLIPGDSIVNIKSTMIGNFIFVNNINPTINKVFIWSIIDNKRINPILIHALTSIKVIDVEYINKKNSEFIYINSDDIPQKLLVDNVEIYILISLMSN